MVPEFAHEINIVNLFKPFNLLLQAIVNVVVVVVSGSNNNNSRRRKKEILN